MSYDTAPDPVGRLVPISSGRAYRIVSPPESALVTRELAAELARVLERFAMEAGFNDGNAARLFFKPGVVGHHRVGRAADIYGVQGAGLDSWKRRWDGVLATAARSSDPGRRHLRVEQERRDNLGWRLYKTLQRDGKWSQPTGYPVQLFGPWTRTEGPWTPISDRLLHAHRDHIHVAK